MNRILTVHKVLMGLLIMGCDPKIDPVPEIFLFDDFEVHWNGVDFLVQTRDGNQVFASPEGGSILTLGRAESAVEYGSGSFSFGENSVVSCGTPIMIPLYSGGGSVTFQAQFEDCDATAELLVAQLDEHRVGFRVSASPQWNRVGLVGRSSSTEKFVGFGAQYDGVDMKGRELPIWCQEQGHGRGAEPLTSVLSVGTGNPAGDWHTSYTCVPWTLTNKGRGLVLENTERAIFDMQEDDSFEVKVWNSSLYAQLFIGDSPSQLVERYTEVFGRMTTLPEWSQQGVILRAHGGAEDVRATVEAARESGVPLAAVWVEDWCGLRSTALGSRMWWNWDVDRGLYPDWEDMVAELTAEGVAVLAYINPYLADATEKEDLDRHLFQEAKEAGYLVMDPTGDIFWMDQAGFDAAVVDLTNPAATRWMQGVVEDLLGTGVKGWMADFSEGLPLDVVLHEGVAETVHNEWPERWAEINHDALEAMDKTDDTLVFHRSGNQYSPGVARSFWLGDQLVTWDKYDGLASVVPALISSGLSGYSMQHADTGGYLSVSTLSVTRDRELFQRWVELNTFTPLLRMHSTNQPDANHQWDSDPETQAHLSSMGNVFAALSDYRLSLMAQAETEGAPLVRGLMFEVPEDERAWTIEDQFMLGPDVLLAPVVESGQAERSLYLPEGTWVHAVSGDSYEGPADVTVPAPIGQPAVFARMGSDAATAIVGIF